MRLALIKDEIKCLKNKLIIAELAWKHVAGSCKYNEEGSDCAECSHGQMRNDDDPRCYSDNCPLIET
jgi:hypothetical protein